MRKNILILGHNDTTQFVDVINQYARVFDENQFNVTVAYLTGEMNSKTQERTLGDECIFFNLPKKHIRGLKITAIKQLLQLCREKQFQIVICHRYKPTYIMLWVAQFLSIPALIFVMHELKTLSSLGRRVLVSSLFRKNMLFAGVSNAVRDDLRANLSKAHHERIITLYNMIDIKLTEPHLFSREAARSALGLFDHDFVYGNIARLAPNKDQKSLISAFRKAKTYCPRAKLVIMGEGELFPSLRLQAEEMGLAEDILFTGFLPEGFKYMSAFDCFVLPSTQEAFGRVLLEAMIAKLPIIATRVHGIPEVLGNVGVLVNPKDPNQLATAMEQHYNLPDKARTLMGEAGYLRATQQFSIPIFHQQFWQLPLLAPLQD